METTRTDTCDYCLETKAVIRNAMGDQFCKECKSLRTWLAKPVTPSPLAPAPSAYDEVMETYTPQQQPAKMNDVLVQLVNMIADVVVMRVTDKMEEMAEAVYDGKDIIDEVTESYQFGNALDSAISDYDISDKIREALQEVTFTVSVD